VRPLRDHDLVLLALRAGVEPGAPLRGDGQGVPLDLQCMKVMWCR